MYVLLPSSNKKLVNAKLVINTLACLSCNTNFVNTKLVMLSVHWSSAQRRSQNAEVIDIKARLLDQTMFLFDCIPFQKGTSLKGKNLLQEGANISFMRSSL